MQIVDGRGDRSWLLRALRRRCLRAGCWIAVAALGVGGCDEVPMAMGDVQAIVVTAPPALWETVGETALTTLEGSIFTVRDDYAFRVRYHAPADSSWAGLRRLRQLLLIGKPSDPWMERALAEANRVEEWSLPPMEEGAAVIGQVRDVWARPQVVTLLVLDEATTPDAAAAEVTERLPELYDIFDTQYREWVRARMFATEPNLELAGVLRSDHGFSLILPQVYDYEVQDSVHIFRNDNPDPSELIRQLAVTWTTLSSSASFSSDADSLIAWRTALADRYYDYPQVMGSDRIETTAFRHRDLDGFMVQSVWSNPPGSYPAAGPFMLRAIACPAQDRLYLIDAWLYAPARDKYEYMIQLEEILNSFVCGDPAGDG